jgi:peptidoglycan/LPS O-acetylase OafA/YrhL
MTGQPAKRLDYIDNLRWVMIVLVLGVHAAVTYGQIGMWYYVEPTPVDAQSKLVFLTFQCFVQAFFMGLLFLLAGYFTSGAYDRKGFRRFAWDRVVRLGIPSVLYGFILHPLTAYFGTNWHTKQAPVEAYGYFLNHGLWKDSAGPMWFAVTLLVFSLLYGLFRAVAPKPKPVEAKTVSFAVVLALGLLIAAIAYGVRRYWWIGTQFHTFQFGFFAQYVVLFVLGIAAFRRKAFDGISNRLGYGLLAIGIVGVPAFIALLVAGGAFQHGFDAFAGHGTWQSGGYALWESLVCVAMGAGLLVLFREHFNRKGLLAKLLSDNSFAIYVVHPPVLVGLTLAFAAVALPPLTKWIIVWPLALAATLVVAIVLRRVPLLKNIL